MERRAFLKLLRIEAGVVAAGVPADALTSFMPLAEPSHDPGLAPKPGVATSKDMERAQVEKAWHGHWHRVNRRRPPRFGRSSEARSRGPMLWWRYDRHRNIQTWTRSARLFTRRNQDRHVMIEIPSPATPQPSSLLPPRRRRSPNDAPGVSRELCRREKYDPIAAIEHSLATLYPSKSSLIVIPSARQQTLATLKSP